MTLFKKKKRVYSEFKQKLKPICLRNKCWFAIKRMPDEEIIDFLKEDVFFTEDLSMDFDEAKEKCEAYLNKNLDSAISPEDQRELYEIMQKFVTP